MNQPPVEQHQHRGHRTPRWPVRVRQLTVLRTEQLTPRMRRLVLGGPELAGFESHRPDEHVKLIFPDADTGELRLPVESGDVLDWPDPFPTTREYTVRAYRPDAGEIDLDFLIHPGGLASDWARTVAVGTRIWVAGPPGWPKPVPDRIGYRLLAGDETALPAIARILAELPADATGHAVIEVADTDEWQDLAAPAGVTVSWLYRDGSGSTLADTVRGCHVPADAGPYVWIAGEADRIRPLRRWVRDLGLPRERVLVSGYWKVGTADHDDEDDADAA